MKGVKVKETKEVKELDADVKVVAAPTVKNVVRATFMRQCNERRLSAGLPMAYTEEEISAQE